MRHPLLSLLLIVLAPVLWLTGLTAARQSQPDFADVQRSSGTSGSRCPCSGAAAKMDTHDSPYESLGLNRTAPIAIRITPGRKNSPTDSRPRSTNTVNAVMLNPAAACR